MSKRLMCVLTLSALLLPQTMWADEEYDALEREFQAAESKWYEQVKDGLSAESPPSPAAKFAPQFRAYAEKHARSPQAIPALAWIVSQGARALPRTDKLDTDIEWALARLKDDHADRPEIRSALRSVMFAAYYVGTEPLIGLYEKVAEVNGDKEVQASALFSLAFTHYNQFGPDDAKDGRKKGEKLFRKIVKEYPDSGSAGKAKGYIFEIERLQIGMTAPEIVGEDVEGKEIRLSQFRGQVVVLDFWGFW